MASTLEGALVNLLTSNSGVTAIVGTRLAPITDPQNIARPKLTYQRLRTDRAVDSGGFTNDGPTGHALATIQIDAWADSLLQSKNAITAVRKAINGYSGTVAGIVINSIQVTDEREIPAQIYEGQGKPVQRVIAELRIQYQDS
jgi:hypothetical protein